MSGPPRNYRAVAPYPPPDGPLEVDELVPGDGEVEIDIGFGRGRSLLERARVAPTARLIGIEIKAKWAHLVAERVHRDGLAGVRVLAGDAKSILSRLQPDGSVARVFVHFPDPWWKKRHAKRRVVSSDLLHDLARLIAPGGELFVQTDVQDRAQDYRRELDQHPAFACLDEAAAENPFGARSNREVRAEEDGLPIHRILARRR